MFRILGSARARRAAVIAVGAVTLLAAGQPAFAQAKPYLFPGGAGLILNFVKPDKATEWEGIMDKIKEGLKASEKPERKAQAASWKIYKATEQPVKDAILYLWVLDGGPTDTEYSVSGILQDLFPKEAAELYKQYSDCYANPPQQVFHLSLVKDFNK